MQKYLHVRTREVLRSENGEARQMVEVLSGEAVLGELPVSRAAYEMLPSRLGVLTIELIVERAEIDSHRPAR